MLSGQENLPIYNYIIIYIYVLCSYIYNLHILIYGMELLLAMQRDGGNSGRHVILRYGMY